MSEVKDPAIKLFGKTIQLPDTAPPLVSDSVDQPPPPSQTSDGDPPPMPSSPYSSVEEHKEQESDKDSIAECDGKEHDGAEPMISEEPTNPSAISTVSNSANSPDSKAVPDEGLPKVAIDDDQSTEEGQNETSDSQEKTLKKPDKILPCPRCNSMDTKFCYYNNYNVNQPRHFCKNCQRYWTAGGTMRNVPVGAGRRKNKYSASHYRQIAVSEALQNISPNEIHHPGLKTNGTVLTFGSDSPLCESMTSALNISGKTPLNVSQNGFQKPGELRPSASHKGKDIADDPQSGSSVTVSSLKDEIVTPSLQNQTCHSFPPQVPCFPGAPWPYPWNVSQWNAPVAQVPPPGFCAVPMPFYPAAPYWGCNVPVPGPWNVQWINPTSLSGNHSAPSSGPNFPTLGKHSRDENIPNLTNSLDEVSIKEHIPEKNLWVPKTLRIDDPGEAAKSSIWATLGIKNEGPDSDCGRSMFKSFQSKDNERCHLSKSSSVLHANPAAMSRSQSFRETT